MTSVPGGTELIEAIGSEALAEQVQGSPFLTALNAGGDTVPGAEYTTIGTRYDEVIQPYTNVALHDPGATNILVQDLCPIDQTGHFNLPYDPVLPATGAQHARSRPRGRAAVRIRAAGYGHPGSDHREQLLSCLPPNGCPVAVSDRFARLRAMEWGIPDRTRAQSSQAAHEFGSRCIGRCERCALGATRLREP